MIEEYYCHCGKLFRSVRAVGDHQRDAHGVEDTRERCGNSSQLYGPDVVCYKLKNHDSHCRFKHRKTHKLHKLSAPSP